MTSSNKHANRSRWCIVAVLVVILAGLMSAPAGAQTKTATATAVSCTTGWINPAGGDWFDPANWSGGTVPDSDDDVCIGLGGTYTIWLEAYAQVNSLHVVPASGKATLLLGGKCEGAFTTGVTAHTEITVGAQGEIRLAGNPNCASVALLASPEISNNGLIRSEAGSGGRMIQGNLLNQAQLVINLSTFYAPSDGLSAILKNEGVLEIANNASLNVFDGAVLQNRTGGSIRAIGSGGVLLTEGANDVGYFEQAGGTTSGTAPIVARGGWVEYEQMGGSSTVVVRDQAEVFGDIGKGDTLIVEGSCGRPATAWWSYAGENAGTIVLTESAECGGSSTLEFVGESVVNTGTIRTTFRTHNSGRYLNIDDLINEGTLMLGASGLLQLNGSYTQTSSGKLKLEIKDLTGTYEYRNYGSLNVSGQASIAGTLALNARPNAWWTGVAFQVITGSSGVSGKFAKLTGALIDSEGRYYRLRYFGGGAVWGMPAQAELLVSPWTGPAGATVDVYARFGWLEGDKLAISFTDSKGVKTVYPKATADESGAFSRRISVPAAAAAGEGKFTVKSLISGLTLTQAFVVS